MPVADNAHAPTPRERSAPKRWVLRLILAACSLAAALGLGEIVARAGAAAAGRPHSRKAAQAELWSLAAGMGADVGAGKAVIPGGQGTSRVMLHPYLGFDGDSGLEQYSDDIEWFRLPESRETFDVVVLGGSVASITAFGAERTLVETLRSDPRLAQRPVRVHVYSRGAFKQPQQVHMLTYLLNLGIEPDAVLNIDGYNELVTNIGLRHRGVSPVQPLLNYWGTVVASAASLDERTLELRARAKELSESGRRRVRACLRLELDRSALATWGIGALLRFHRARLVAVQGEYGERLATATAEVDASASSSMLGPREPADVPLLEGCVRVWFESSRLLRAICDARGIAYVHVLQPTLHDSGSKPLTQAERESGTLEQAAVQAVQQGYPRLREQGLALAAEGAAFLDASLLFSETAETLYYDACHFKAPGTDMLAREAALALLRKLPQ